VFASAVPPSPASPSRNWCLVFSTAVATPAEIDSAIEVWRVPRAEMRLCNHSGVWCENDGRTKSAALLLAQHGSKRLGCSAKNEMDTSRSQLGELILK
jgi:hypothetical protein